MDPAVPVSLAIVAALFFSFSTMLVRARVRRASPIVALALSLSVNVVVLWSVSLLWYDVTVDLWRWRYFILAGVLAPVLGRFFNYSGIDKLGVNLSTPITYANPLVSVALALAFLGERLSLLGLVGALLVIAGGVVLGTVRGDGAVSFKRKYLVLPVLAAVAYGSSQVLRKVGIDLVNEPVLAAAVTTTTSWSLLVVYLLFRRHSHDLVLGRSEATFFGLAGLAGSVAIPTLYLALQLGTVVVVTPLMNTTPLFVLLLSYLFFREEELFTARVLAGTVGIVAGVVLLSTFGTV
jgi:uncharacterized membrane protein